MCMRNYTVRNVINKETTTLLYCVYLEYYDVGSENKYKSVIKTDEKLLVSFSLS